MIRGIATNYLEAFTNFKKIVWVQNSPIYGIFTKLSDAIEEYAMLMYSQTREIVSEKIKRSLIMAQFLESCPKRWHQRISEVTNLELNISDQIKQILDATKHELLTNNWNNRDEDEQVAYLNRGRSDQKQVNARYMNKRRPISRDRNSIICYNCYKRGHLKKDCRSLTYCQTCRQEHKPGSVECKNSWKYGQLNRKDRGNNYRYASQERRGNQAYEGSTNQYRNSQRERVFQNTPRGNDTYRGRDTYRQNHRSKYEHRQRYQNNLDNETENLDRVNAVKIQSEEQLPANLKHVYDWDVINDAEGMEENFQ